MTGITRRDALNAVERQAGRAERKRLITALINAIPASRWPEDPSTDTSNSTLALTLRISTRAVQRGLDRLQDAGLITRDNANGGHSRTISLAPYAATLTGNAKPKPPVKRKAKTAPVTTAAPKTKPAPQTGLPLNDKPTPKPRKRNLNRADKERIAREDPNFEALRQAYPPKPDGTSIMLAAIHYHDRVIATGVDPEQVISAAKQYAKTRKGKDEQFTKAIQSWIEEKNWEAYSAARKPDNAEKRPSMRTNGPECVTEDQYKLRELNHGMPLHRESYRFVETPEQASNPTEAQKAPALLKERMDRIEQDRARAAKRRAKVSNRQLAEQEEERVMGL